MEEERSLLFHMDLSSLLSNKIDISYWYYVYIASRNLTTSIVNYFVPIFFGILHKQPYNLQIWILFHCSCLTYLVLVSISMSLDLMFKCAVCCSILMKVFITLMKFPFIFRLLKVVSF